jgi:hypothetical protein
MKKLLFLLTQNLNHNCYKEFAYTSAVVVSDAEENARHIHPSDTADSENNFYDVETWVHPAFVSVREIGECTDENMPLGTVVCASCNEA